MDSVFSTFDWLGLIYTIKLVLYQQIYDETCIKIIIIKSWIENRTSFDLVVVIESACLSISYLDAYPRATSHTRLRARDHCTSNTLNRGKSGAGPSSLLHTTLEGPTEYISECEMDVKSTWVPTWHQMDQVLLTTWTIFKNHCLEVGLPQN